MEEEEDNWDAVSNESDNEVKDAVKDVCKERIPNTVVVKEKEGVSQKEKPKSVPYTHEPNYKGYQKKCKQGSYYKGSKTDQYKNDYYEDYYSSSNKRGNKESVNRIEKPSTVNESKKVTITLVPAKRKMHVIKFKDNQTKIVFSDQHNVKINS